MAQRREKEKKQMSETDLDKLVKAARKVPMSPSDKESQRRSFAFGNTQIENGRITKQTVDDAAEHLRRSGRRG